ncbi:RND superfamily putative drug exporter [Bacillus oleivorans]|uniref:RND superfamily putative drug exporter n=1 Tax=Bacillus oleivorans TaxID=1448271 RepID=A0A285D5S6_9BACI|nr:MMPL family transporter [Bacillus oleivorans]SNX75025.1 RND superfamily putative drug exporter [Bacillus oleivorans]
MGREFFRYLGRLTYRYRWAIAAFWALLFIFTSIYAQRLPDMLKESGFTPEGSESDLGFESLEEELGMSPSTLNLIYTSNHLDLTEESETARIIESLENLKTQPYITNIQVNPTPRLTEEKGIQSVIVKINLNNQESLEVYPELREMITAPQGMELFIDGGTATLYEIQQATKHDLVKAELIGIPIALIVLLIIFGTVGAALLPVFVGMVSVSVTLGTTYFISYHFDVSNFLPNIVMMLGLALGIDYALFVVSRFREELKRHRSVESAVARTMEKAGHSVFFSGFAVLIGMFGMLFIRLPIMYSLCLGGVLIVLMSVLVSSTLLPALLGIFGHSINRLQVFPALQKKLGNSTLWRRIAFGVMKRPAFLTIFISLILILLMTPIANMKLGVPTAEVLPPSYESRMGSDLFDQHYDNKEASPIYIVVKTPESAAEEDSILLINEYEKTISKINGIQEVRSFLDTFENQSAEMIAGLLQTDETRENLERRNLLRGEFALLTAIPAHDPNSPQASDLVEQLRNVKTESLETYVTGHSALRFDMLNRIYEGLPFLILFIMTVTYLTLLYAFKSVLIPLKAVLMNVLSLGASLGIVVIVFQNGWFAEALQITSTGYVNLVMPVTIFSIVFGISMDYEVFLISRIMEEYEKTGDNDRSTAEGLQKTGGLITSAALILMTVVGSFIFTNIEITKALGVGLFCAVFIDATIIRIIVVPALMKMLGHANWWAPRWLFGR